MRFGKTLREKTLKEWRFYSVDYKELKQTLNGKKTKDDGDDTPHNDESSRLVINPKTGNVVNEEAFFGILDASKEKLTKFYEDKESWALGYMDTLEERVESLRLAAANQPVSSTSSPSKSIQSGESSLSSFDPSSSDEEDGEEKKDDDGEMYLTETPKRLLRRNSSMLKEEYLRVGKSDHFQRYIYAKKSLATFLREISLLLEFVDLNKTAFSKILKKFDKVTGSSLREETMRDILEKHPYLEGEVLKELKCQTKDLLDEAEELKPRLPEGWEERKVYTIGCFDLFHRGHQNVLMSLREFGYFIVAGIHDDASYFKLKKKYTIDNLETRMKNVKPFVDQLYVIPSTDPLPYIRSMVSPQDVEEGRCCYARGDDMLAFPGREWVESVMPVHFVPRTEACSSTLLRTIYHAGDAELRRKAAFAKTRYDGKPVDEDGNVLKLTSSGPVMPRASA